MINLYGPISHLGYAVHCQNMIKAFLDTNTDINLTPIGQIQNDPYFEPYWKAAVKARTEYSSKDPSLFIFHDEFSNQANGNPLFVFSIFETTSLKQESIQMLKRGPADVILTTTKRHKEILDSLNLGKEVKVLNEGVDDTIFNTIPVDKHINTGKFTYITVGKKEKRKNTSLIIKSFIELMKENNVALIAHTFNPFVHKDQNTHPFKNLQSWTDINPQEFGFVYKGFDNKAHKFSYKECDLYFSVPGIQTAEMGCLYQSANVGIQASRGEGWDLPLVEMLACGIPCIASNCMGHSEYLDDAPETQKSLIVKSIGTEPANDNIWFNGNQGNWDLIDKDMFKMILEQTFKDKEKYLNKSEEISSYMTKNFPWTKATNTFLTMIK